MKKYLILGCFMLMTCVTTTLAQDIGPALSLFTGEKSSLTAEMRSDMELVIPYIQDFDEVYDVNAEEKIYHGSAIKWTSADLSQSMIWTPTRSRDDEVFMNQIVQDYLLNQTIQSTIARYTRYVSNRYIDNYGSCSRQNFMRAFDEFGVMILEPSQTLNINNLLAGLDGYCMGNYTGEYLFYQGVCGFSTQVRRNALINPYLTTVRRSNHGNRRQAYYGDEIVGDDAAIYEMDKQLIIQNQSEYPIYMQTIELAGKKYLLSAVPVQTDKVVELSRESVGPMMGRVTRTIKDKVSEDVIDRDVYNSYYRGVIKVSN